MNVVYYTSDFFSEMCGVAIESLCCNNTNADCIDVYVVEDHVSDINKERLLSIVSNYDRNLHFIKMPTQKEMFPDVDINLGRTFARMILTKLLPKSVDRVLSLDSDTLVLDNIVDMYNTDFENNSMCGVYDCLGKAMQEGVLKKGPSLKYCNAGMYLINLDKWRKIGVDRLFIDKISESQNKGVIYYFLEQDIMNLLFENDLKLLAPQYNLLTSIYLFNYQELMRIKKPVTYYTEKEIVYAKEHPAIVHATTCFYVRKRMWVKDSDHPYHDWYLKYRNQTPYKDCKQIEDGRTWNKKLYGSLWHCVPRGVAVFLASIVVSLVRPLYAKMSKKFAFETIATQSAT